MPTLLRYAQRNPTLDKVAVRLGLAGAEGRAPILAGFRARVDFSLHAGEVLRWARVFTLAGFEQALTVKGSGQNRWADVEFGADFDSGAAAVRNFLEWKTSRGTQQRQCWVKDLPASRSIYVNNEEAQRNIVPVYVDPYATERLNRCATISINLLPYFNDEFFVQQWYRPNAWANTLRTWGGAATCELFWDGALAAAEQDVADVDGLFLDEPSAGVHSVTARLRALEASATYVDVVGRVHVRMIPCP